MFNPQGDGAGNQENAPGSSWPLGLWVGDLVGQRFRIDKFLGEGGMGWVFKARDVVLDRPVALKFMKHQTSCTPRHTLREARLQASIDHENICRVYETGQDRGHPYLAMQFLEGHSLGDFVLRLSVDAKLVLIQKVAQALHQAHGAGMVHRDIKPSNIVVCENDRGEWVPFLVDFGLARRTREVRSTVMGGMQGTPSFMAPEQVHEDWGTVDRRTDVYGLGATLFYLLSGEVPHQAPTAAAAWLALLNDEVPPVTRFCPGLDPAVVAIVAKALAKNANQRYASALAFSQDLGRYLAGEPVQARRLSLVAKTGYFLRRHRWWVRTAAVAAVVAMSVGAWSFLVQRRLTIQAEIEKAFLQHTESMSQLHRQFAMLPPHDIRRDRGLIAAKMDQVKVEMEALGTGARGPGHVALGSALLELGQPKQALAHLERAWNHQHQQPEVALALANALKDLLFQELAELETLADIAHRRRVRTQIQGRYREKAQIYLEKITPDVQGNHWHAKALEALFGDRPADALQYWDALYQSQPLNYGALLNQGKLLTRLGDAQRDQGNLKEAALTFQRAQEVLSQAQDIARSDPHIRLALAQVHFSCALMDYYDPGEVFFNALEHARAACDIGLLLDVGHAEIYRFLGTLASMEADALIKQGKDPSTAWDIALEMAQKSLQIQPRQPLAHNIIGMVHLLRGRRWMGMGTDPLPALLDAEQALGQGLQLSPNHPALNNNQGLVSLFQAQLKGSAGGAENPQLEKAIGHFERALAAEPHRKDTALNLGAVYWTLAEERFFSGQDPRPQLCAAGWSFDRVLATHPAHGPALLNRASVGQMTADFEQALGRVSSDSFWDIWADLNKAEAEMPNSAEVANGKALAFFGLAKVAWRQGETPFPFLDQARDSATQALVLRPHWGLALFNLGIMDAYAAQIKAAQGMPFSQEAAWARSELNAALEAHPVFSDAWVSLGDLALLEATHHGIDRQAEERLVTAYQCFQEALALDGENAYAYFGMAKHAGLTFSGPKDSRAGQNDGFDAVLTYLRKASHLQPYVLEFRLEFVFVFLQQWNLAKQQPETLKALAQSVRDWREDLTKSPMPPDFVVWVSDVFHPLLTHDRSDASDPVPELEFNRLTGPSAGGKDAYFTAQLRWRMKTMSLEPIPPKSQKGEIL